ncbi:hypothetical protein Q5M85_13175 [Paraclostridium bifermentans]|nr:hypothetical protein [Paraclostridium bifermentans]
MKLYALCCITVLGIFIYGGQGEEPVMKEVFNEIQIEESTKLDIEIFAHKKSTSYDVLL